MDVLLVKNLFKALQWHSFLGIFYGYGRHACSQHHSLQCDGWWLRKAIRIPPAAGTTVMETCKPGSWSLLAGTHAINFHADVGKKHFTLRGILSSWFVVVNKDSGYHMTTRASVSFTCFWSPIWRRGTLTWAWPVRIDPSAGFLMTEMLAVQVNGLKRVAASRLAIKLVWTKTACF